MPLPDGVPADAAALAVNVTSVGETTPGFLVGAAGRYAAAGDVVPQHERLRAGRGGDDDPAGLDRRASRSTRTAAGTSWSTSSVGSPGRAPTTRATGLFVPLAPQRLLDTRKRSHGRGRAARSSSPASFPGAAALVTNVTATRADRAGFVTAYPAGTPRPDTSTLNPAMFEHTVANMAITQLSDRGLAYYSHAGSDVVVDVTGMFTGSPVAATLPPPPNSPAFSRVLLVGDSTLAAVSLLYPQSQSAFIGFEGIVDAASCRRLLRPVVQERRHAASSPTPRSRRSSARRAGSTCSSSRPDTTTGTATSRSSSTPSCNAGRAKGAHTILWLSYTENQHSPEVKPGVPGEQRRPLPTRHAAAVQRRRARRLAGVHRPASTTGRGTAAISPRSGSWLQTDFVSRWMAAIEHRPCPRPWGPGGPSFDPCPPPESIGPVPNVRRARTDRTSVVADAVAEAGDPVVGQPPALVGMGAGVVHEVVDARPRSEELHRRLLGVQGPHRVGHEVVGDVARRRR